MPNITPEPIMRVAMGYMASKHLFIASKIGIFEGLAGTLATLDELAARCGTPPRTLRISIDAMVSLGFLEREGDRYRNSPVAETFLSGGSGDDLRPTLRYFDHLSYRLWLDFEQAVRAGEGQRQFNRFNEEEQRIFSMGVEAVTSATATALSTSYDFSQHRSVLDVAGGTGSFLIPILRQHAALSGTLFELPGACAVARQRLAREPDGSRIRVVEGDFFGDPLPDGHDVLILANTVHTLSEAHNVELLRNMRAHVEAGARLLLVDLWMDMHHSEPAAALLMSGEYLVVTGEGQAYSEAKADEWLTATGWSKIERRRLVGASSVIIAAAT